MSDGPRGTERADPGARGSPGDPFVAPLDPSGRLDEMAAGAAALDSPYGIQLGLAATREGFRLEYRAPRALRLPRPGSVRRVPLASETLDQLQASLAAAGAGASAYGSPRRLFDLAQRAPDHLELVRGVWIRRVERPARDDPRSRD